MGDQLRRLAFQDLVRATSALVWLGRPMCVVPLDHLHTYFLRKCIHLHYHEISFAPDCSPEMLAWLHKEQTQQMNASKSELGAVQ